MITLNLKLSVLFIECEVKGALINPLSWASLGNTNVYPNYIWSKSDDQWSEKKIDKGSQRVKLFWGQGREPRTPLPPMASPPGRGTLSKLLSNATVKLLQKDWGEHYSRPSMVSPIPSKLQSHMQCSPGRISTSHYWDVPPNENLSQLPKVISILPQSR